MQSIFDGLDRDTLEAWRRNADRVAVAGSALSYGILPRALGLRDEVRAAKARLNPHEVNNIELGANLVGGAGVASGAAKGANLAWKGVKALGGRLPAISGRGVAKAALSTAGVALPALAVYNGNEEAMSAPARGGTKAAMAKPKGAPAKPAANPRQSELFAARAADRRDFPSMDQMLKNIAAQQGGKISINQLNAFNEMAARGAKGNKPPSAMDLIRMDAHKRITDEYLGNMAAAESLSGKERDEAMRQSNQLVLQRMVDLAGGMNRTEDQMADLFAGME